MHVRGGVLARGLVARLLSFWPGRFQALRRKGLGLETDIKSSDGGAVQTVHVDALVVAAWNAEARRTGRTLEAIVRECLAVPPGRLVVVAEGMTAALAERFKTGQAQPDTPWPELLQPALAHSLRQPPKGQL